MTVNFPIHKYEEEHGIFLTQKQECMFISPHTSFDKQTTALFLTSINSKILIFRFYN